jgi:hypothetical protein
MAALNGRGPDHCYDSGGASRFVDTTEGDGQVLKRKSSTKQWLSDEQLLIAYITKHPACAKIAEQMGLRSEHFKEDSQYGKWFAMALTAAKEGKTGPPDLAKMRRSAYAGWHHLADLIERAPEAKSDRHAANTVRMFARRIIAAATGGQARGTAANGSTGEARPNAGAPPGQSAGKRGNSKKATWAESLALDQKVRDFDFRVAGVLLCYVDSTTLTTFVSQRTIADRMARSERAIRYTIATLIRLGYLTVESGTRGVGGSNRPHQQNRSRSRSQSSQRHRNRSNTTTTSRSNNTAKLTRRLNNRAKGTTAR